MKKKGVKEPEMGFLNDCTLHSGPIGELLTARPLPVGATAAHSRDVGASPNSARGITSSEYPLPRAWERSQRVSEKR